jgi:hypothetical protein
MVLVSLYSFHLPQTETHFSYILLPDYKYACVKDQGEDMEKINGDQWRSVEISGESVEISGDQWRSG